MSSSDVRETVMLHYTRDGVTGYGEGAPIVRYGEFAAAARAALERVLPILNHCDPWAFTPLLQQVKVALGPRQQAALAAVDLALCDWRGKVLQQPLHRHFGLALDTSHTTSFSIGIDTPELIREKVLEAEPYAILKIKLGLGRDEETIAAIRALTSKPLRVDANEGWTDPDEAVRRILWLETQGVELVEQPMPAHMLDEVRWVRGKVHLPLIADEACTSAEAIPLLREAYDGINVKLDKAGGVMEAARWVAIARACGMQVMLGCMVSSSCSCTAAAQLAALADYCDLDGNLLIANDPFRGVTVRDGVLVLPAGPGLGVEPVTPPEPPW